MTYSLPPTQSSPRVGLSFRALQTPHLIYALILLLLALLVLLPYHAVFQYLFGIYLLIMFILFLTSIAIFRDGREKILRVHVTIFERILMLKAR